MYYTSKSAMHTDDCFKFKRYHRKMIINKISC